MHARGFFVTVARPLYDRHQTEPDSEELLWASIVSLNHVRDYHRLDGGAPRNKTIHDQLAVIANALKHAKPQRSGNHVDPKTLRSDFFSIPDIFAEPNIFASWVVEVDGKTCSIGPVLKAVVDFWSKELDAAGTATT
jgi:hypothetical protein